MSKRLPELLIEDILEAIEKIVQFTRGHSKERFHSDSMVIDAVVRNLEVIGEASNRLPEEFKAKYPGVKWEKIVGLRNRIVHEYFGIDLEIIWAILQGDLPEFKKALLDKEAGGKENSPEVDR